MVETQNPCNHIGAWTLLLVLGKQLYLLALLLRPRKRSPGAFLFYLPLDALSIEIRVTANMKTIVSGHKADQTNDRMNLPLDANRFKKSNIKTMK
ncbi:MAG: hypothetical protein VB088_07960 [Sphaerochaeta sp.]|nr:hypothetical protein [Sphaerochaeta sp.]